MLYRRRQRAKAKGVKMGRPSKLTAHLKESGPSDAATTARKRLRKLGKATTCRVDNYAAKPNDETP